MSKHERSGPGCLSFIVIAMFFFFLGAVTWEKRDNVKESFKIIRQEIHKRTAEPTE